MDITILALIGATGISNFAGVWVLGLPQKDARELSSHRFFNRLSQSVERRLPFIMEVRRQSRLAARRSEGLRSLPEMLDILTLGLSAGLSFDASLELYCNRSTTELSIAFRHAMDSWRMGIATRDEALSELATELELAALKRFSDAVSQALAFGSPLAAVLEQQSQAIRDEQRSQVEEQIEKVPVKMLIPLGTLIVPAMLLAILGPLLGSAIALG
ncbi:type II secretion system F family protein [Olegusella massiliensis]|uniref:type II secretion system F family protein n=1 Tax=Olegusella massiliensis TaxID=1776381 RepID=UPI0003AE1238|nr:type II secretion system F family protein [Olegusella massiliensis]ERL12691.1 type II secretion system protein F [Coriobacteriaceae bacterium BV3Ac1]MBS5866242.1 type II secretion system F family protein [Coriobacteriaceae bacterium]